MVSLSLWGPIQYFLMQGTAQINTLALSDSDNSVASVFMVRKSGTLDRVGVSISAKSGSSATILYNVGLVTIDASGMPTSTAYGGSAPAQPTLTSLTTGLNWITLATPATAVVGDIIAARIWPEGAVAPDGSNNVTVRRTMRTLSTNLGLSLPYGADWQTAWAKTTEIPLIAVRYSDGTVGQIPAVNATSMLSTAFTSATSPDEVGAKFQLPFEAPCVGARVHLDPTAGAATSFEVRLYNAAGTVLGSAVVPAGVVAASTMCSLDVFWAPVTLAALTDYRLTILATSTDSGTILVLPLGDTDSKNAVPCGEAWGLTTRADLGAWTDTPNTVPMSGLWLDTIVTGTTKLFMGVLE